MNHIKDVIKKEKEFMDNMIRLQLEHPRLFQIMTQLQQFN